MKVTVYICPDCERVVTGPGLTCEGTVIGSVLAEHKPQHMVGVQFSVTKKELRDSVTLDLKPNQGEEG